MDNAFVNIDSFANAQNISDSPTVDMPHEKLDTFAEPYCPVIKKFNLQYHWSIMQVEYAADIVFKRQEELQSIYDHIVRVAIHTVKPDNIATFLGRKLHGKYQDEMGNNFNTRIMGTRIKHTMGPVSIKMYDKFSLILRIETTVNNVSFFKHYRKVEHRDGSCSMKLAQMKKSIYSLSALREILFSANHRYLQFISSIEDISIGVDSLKKVSRTATESNRSYKGFNFFSEEDQILLETIASGEFTISGFQNKHLCNKIHGKNSAQISRLIKRLHLHGLIKKVDRTYKYYLTKFGCQVINMGLKLKELVIIPELEGYGSTI